MKRQKVRTVADATRSIRAGLRRTLVERLPDWMPVWVRPEPGRCRIERTGDPDVEFSLDAFPVACRPLVLTLLDLLDEQAAMARVAVTVAQADLETDARRRSGAGSAALTQQRAAARRDAEILKAARAILKDEPQIKGAALAAMLADRGHGGRYAIEKKLPRLLGTEKSTEDR